MILKMTAESTGYKRKSAILGDMLELGDEEVMFHQKAGAQVGMNHFDILITAGPLSMHMKEEAKKRKTQVVVTENSEDAAAKASEIVSKGDLVIVKRYRGMKMENLVRRLQEQS